MTYKSQFQKPFIGLRMKLNYQVSQKKRAFNLLHYNTNADSFMSHLAYFENNHSLVGGQRKAINLMLQK